MLIIILLILVALKVHATPQSEDEYPIGALKCHYTLKRGKNAGVAGNDEMTSIVCPEGQDRWCIKQEIEGLDRALCGKTEYFGDKYEPDPIKKCIFRKCASECTEGTEFVHSELIEEFREQNTYKRRTFCCDTDYCNGASSAKPHFVFLFISSFLTSCFLLLRCFSSFWGSSS
mmetsp:Transcript_12698/g.19045  ORF Transcript_12698/g.19045 Transcript_12698/m.19045 type:complete len:173 (-) Transcript_12698:33-551(-)